MRKTYKIAGFSDVIIQRFLEGATEAEKKFFELRFVKKCKVADIMSDMFISNSTVYYQEKKIQKKLQDLVYADAKKDSSSRCDSE